MIKIRYSKKIYVLAMAVLMAVQALSAGMLRGTVVEAGTGEALIQASVRVLAASDSALVKAAVTNTSGAFAIDGLKAGKYIVEASYVGFAPETRNITMTAADMRLKQFALSESAIALKEATVTGIRTPVKVMEDTVEFSAESYKTQPNAVVEDLLKRLPGVEVNSDGKITANGKEVTKILVDGKEFFSDDPTVASRNLPVNMVEKLQVVDRKSDLARLTGVDDGEEETVINLTVKKGMANGWFGNAEAGYGTDQRYKGGFIVNRFWNGNQLTFLGSANNINEPGFADGAGGRFMRFGGANGITSAQSLGLNFNVGKEEIFRVGGDIMYSHTDRDTRTSSERVYNGGVDQQTRSQKYSRDKGHNVRADFRVQWNPDSFNTFEFRPNISLNYNNSSSIDTSAVYRGNFATDVNRSLNRDFSKGNSFEFGGRLIYNHKFRSKPGRSFSVFANYRMSNVREKSDSYSWNKFFQFNDSIDLYDQWADNHTWSNSINTRLSWTEPLGNAKNGHFLTLAYSFSYRWNNADKLTYDHPVSFPDGWEGEPVIDPELVFNEDLSNRFRNDYMSQDIRLGYRHVSKKGQLNAGISLVPQTSKSINLIDHSKDIPRRSVFNYAPFLRYRMRFSKSRSLTLDYNGRSSQPSMNQLQPVADYSDPLRVVIGNPNLDPSFSHNVRLRFQDFNQDKQRSIMAMADAQVVQNSIVSRMTFNEEIGGQVTTYENVNGVWNIRGMNMISFPLRNKAFTFNNHIFLNYNHNVGFNNGERNRTGAFSVSESLGFAWRPEYVELEIRPRYSFQSTRNSIKQISKNGDSNDTDVHSYGGSFYGTYTAPFGLVLSSDINYSATKGYANGFDTRTWLWNASISYQFLRGRNAAITLKAYDILGQSDRVRMTSPGNYTETARYNSLGRYVMMTVSYKFTTFGKGEQPRDRNFDERGPMGPPPGMGRHRGPGGPGGPR